MCIQVSVNGFRGKKMTVDLCDTKEQMKTMIVQQLRHKIAAILPAHTDMETIRLYTDELLDDDSKLLSECGVEHMSVIQLALRVDGGLTV